jgi:hypothetical protein
MTGFIAAYASEAASIRAVDRLRAAGLQDIETYAPVEGDEQEHAGSRIGLLAAAGGVIGAAFMFGLETLATATSWGYPVDIGGRPPFSWPAYIPIAVAFGLMCAGAAGLLGFLVLLGIWRLWDPVDDFEAMRGASRDRWIVHVHTEEEMLEHRALAVLGATGPIAMRTMSHDLEEVPA